MKTKEPQPTNLRFTPEGKRLLKALVAKLGLNMASVMELAVRVLAEREKVK